MRLKGGVRILALNGAPFDRKDVSELVVGLIGRQGMIEGALSFKVTVDGSDATARIIKAVKGSRFSGQIRIIATNGVALGGLNIMDFREISASLSVGIISVTRGRPRKSLLRKALSAAKNGKGKAELLDRIYEGIEIVRMRGFYAQLIKIDKDAAERRIDEALSLLRVAHIVASGIGRGQSKGRI